MAKTKYPRIERRKVGELAPGDNPRRITADGKAKLKQSIEQLGNLQPITFNIRTGKVLGGHQRIEVLREAGESETDVWCVDLPAAKEKAAMLALNTHAGEWDEEKLSDFLNGLEGEMDAEFFGLADALNRSPAQQLEVKEEEKERPGVAAEAQKKWKVKRGQIFQAGRHRIMCGSCLQPGDLDRLVNGAKVSLIYSDAPYGISIVNSKGKVSTGLAPGPGLRQGGGDKAFGKVGGIHRGMKAKPIIQSNVYPEIVGDDNGGTARQAFGLLWRRYPRAAHIWWGANHFSDVFPASPCWIVWDKDNGESFFADAELAWCSAKTAVRIFKHTWNGLIKESERGERRCHPTQKPVALARWCLENYSKQGDAVLDPFLGGGASMLACEEAERVGYGMEISPEYCAATLERLEKKGVKIR
jgi:hypothetical protein